MKPQLRITGDGSHTLFLPELDENYHSVHGAFTESMHVFIRHGLQAFPRWPQPGVRILEIGLGTGLNALLTLDEAAKHRTELSYCTIEAFPLSGDMVRSLNYLSRPELAHLSAAFSTLHELPWNKPVVWAEYILLEKIQGTVQAEELPESAFDIVYFDAFAPEKQPEMWEEGVFAKISRAMSPGALLVTYCAKGSVKRTLKSCGLQVEALPGPPGKREMTRAWK